MRDKNNILSLVQLPIDYIGFIFYPLSPRYIGNTIPLEILNLIPSTVKKAGVFVNAPLIDLLLIAEKNHLDCIQLHGNETPEYCAILRENGYKVIKAFKAEQEMFTHGTVQYNYVCDYFMFDTPTPKFGGSGIKFDWTILKQQKISLPFFLSGGIGPDDIEIIKGIDINEFYAVDINSKFEIKPGIKNIDLIKGFIEKVK